MEILKRMISALLALVLVAGMLPVSAMAEEDTVQETVPAETVAAEETVPETTEEEAETVPEEPEVYTLEPVVEFYVNPLYTGEVVDILSAMPMPLSGDETTYYTDPVEIGRLLRPAMEARKTVVTMGYQIPTSEYNDDTFRILMRQAVDEAVKHTGVPTQGDYLLWQYEYMELSASGINDGTDCYFTLTFAISYYTTAEQEAQVDAAVEILLRHLDISGSDYDKISTVYDYITDNIVYDYKTLNDSSYMLKHTAYAALNDGTAVCQGYALLLYRLALEMGIDCRIVTGTGNGEDHAWNLVKLDGKYYNADATWDASRVQADMEYKYYLLPDSGFSDHVRDDAYRTAAFYAEYPMGTTAYTPGSGTEPTEPEETVPQETIPGETVPGETEPEDPNILTFSVSGDKNMSAPSQASISEKNSAIPSVSKVFDVEPSVTAPYATGKLSDSLLNNALATLNYFRYVTHLPQVQLSDELNENAQYGAVVMAANNVMSHYPTKPADMDDAFYEQGYAATGSSNLSYNYGYSAAFSLQLGLIGCLQDADSYNISRLGHRRWLLNPQLLNVGFGYARSVAGENYSLTKVFDSSGAAVDYDFVAFPASGNFPIDLFDGQVPWSVSLNPAKFQTPSLSQITVTLTRQSDGKVWSFDASTGAPTSTFTPCLGVDTGYYGIPNCIIFNPGYYDLSSYIGAYSVEIRGLKTRDGSDAKLAYEVNFFDAEENPAPHTHSYTGVSTAPTCTEQGYMTYTCDCGDSYVGDYVAALGHAYDNGKVTTDPGCETEGVKTYTCANDSAHTYTETIPPTGHSYGDWYTTKTATVEAEGEERRDCENCGVFETRVVEKLEITTNGTCGENVTWSFDKSTGTLTISGLGDMDDTWFPYDWSDEPVTFAPWYDLADQITSVVIEYGVTSVGHFAFYGCTNLIDVSIPESVTLVGCAFIGCDSLKEINIPASVTDFRYPTNEGVCSGLTKITVDENNTVYSSDEAGMLYNKQKTKFLGCPTGYQGAYAIPEGVTEIGDWAFTSCSNLTAVQFPQSVRKIGDFAFFGCSNLREVIMPEGVTTIGTAAFSYCENLLELTIPASVTAVDQMAFSFCHSLESVCFEGDAPDFEIDCFYRTTTTVYYPANNPTWTEDVRENYGGSIDWMPSETTGSCGENVNWKFDIDTNVLTIYGTGAMSDFAKGKPWAFFCGKIPTVIVEEGVTTLGTSAFAGCDALENVQLPETLEAIHDGAFFGCNSLVTVDLPDTLKQLGAESFTDCSNLESISIPDNVMSIGYRSFADCSSLAYIKLPEKLESIGDQAFSGCSSLTEIEAAEQLAYVGNAAFDACSNLKEITFTGNAPYFETLALVGLTATAYYPASNPTWTADVMQNYGGTITWVAYGEEAPHTHTYTDAVTAPTCTQRGYTTYTCDCGDSYVGNYVAALGHAYDTGVVTTAPGCETEGVKTYTCANDSAHTYTEPIPATGHGFKGWYIETVATMEADGEARRDCADCDVYESRVIPKLTREGTPGMIRTEGASVRSEPSTEGEIIGSYRYGTIVTTYETRDGWIRTGEGWVWAENVDTEDVGMSHEERSLREKLANGETEILIDADITLTEDLYIPEYVAVTVDAGGSLTVPAGVTLDVGGWLTVFDGELTVKKNGILNVSNENWAAIDIWGGSLDVTGANISGVPENAIRILLNSSTVRGIADRMLYGDYLVESTADVNTALAAASRYGYMQLDPCASFTLTNSITLPEACLWNMYFSAYEITVPSGVKVTNNGDMWVQNANLLIFEKGSQLINNGYMYIDPYSEVLMFGQYQDNGYIEGYITPSSMPQSDLENFLNQNDGYGWIHSTETTLERNLTINIPFGLYKYGKLVVTDGVTLTLNDMVYLYEGAEIIVEDGGKLVVNGPMQNDGTVTILDGGTLETNAAWEGNDPIYPHTHSYTKTVTKPTCTERGYTTYTCTCGESYVDNYVEAIGHAYDGGTVTTAPGCVTEGVKTFACANDASHTYTETIPAVGHTTGEWKSSETSHWHECTACGEKLDEAAHSANLCTICGYESVTEGDHPYSLGDVNHDGKINAKDSTLILQYSVGVLKDTSKFCEICANVNGDSKLNAKDATMILQYSVGLRTDF